MLKQNVPIVDVPFLLCPFPYCLGDIEIFGCGLCWSFMRLVNLERSRMAIPTKDFTIRESIATCATSMMCLPLASSFSTSVVPHKLFVTSYIGMIVRTSTALASSSCSSPCSLNNTVWKSHCLTPLLLISFPYSSRGLEILGLG